MYLKRVNALSRHRPKTLRKAASVLASQSHLQLRLLFRQRCSAPFYTHPHIHRKNQWDHPPSSKMPGAGKQPPEVQENIKELLEAGFDPTTIHRRLKVGRSSIYRMKRCLQQHGTAYMPTELNKKNGRPKVLTAEQELVGAFCLSDCSKLRLSNHVPVKAK